MSYNLTKGGSYDLKKSDGSPLLKLIVRMLWVVASEVQSKTHDLDVGAFMLGSNGKQVGPDTVVFYGRNDLASDKYGCVVHSGDDRTGATGEEMIFDLSKIVESSEVDIIDIPVFLYDAKAKGQKFGDLSGASLVISDGDTDEELVRYNIEELGDATSILAGRVVRDGGGFKVEAVGAPIEGEIGGYLKSIEV
ncbi:MAG: TerD family protein [bacterium]|nr:TerD family protein [bacterium]